MNEACGMEPERKVNENLHIRSRKRTIRGWGWNDGKPLDFWVHIVNIFDLSLTQSAHLMYRHVSGVIQ